MWNLILSNIRQRPTRTCVSILAVSLGVVLILVSVGLSFGQFNDQAGRTRRIGGDFMLQPSGASLFLGLNSGALPVKIQQVIEQVEGIHAATPVLVKFVSEGFQALFGIAKESFLKVNGGLEFSEGQMFEKPFEVVVDTIYAADNKVEVAQKIELLGHEFSIAGIFQAGTAGRILVPLDTLQEMNGTPRMATVFFIRAKRDMEIEAVEAKLRERFENYKISRTQELEELLASSAPAFQEFKAALVFMSVAISFLVTLLAMYSTIVERTREIGILKSLGASRGFIVQLILRESLVVCLLGVIAGFILTVVLITLITARFPSVPVDIPSVWVFTAVVIAFAGGILGALYPAIKAAKLDPVKALGYE